MFWVPTSDTIAISNFSKWEQAFRIYANVYTKRFPHRSSELIQYHHIIHTIAGMYVWDNVYSYDKEFHMHLSKHPNRSSSVILQQAWSMKLKDRLVHRDFQHGSGHGGNFNHSHQGGDKRGGRNSGGGGLANDIIVESALSVLDADMSTDVPMNLVVNLDIPY